jgi:hypothetical protein
MTEQKTDLDILTHEFPNKVHVRALGLVYRSRLSQVPPRGVLLAHPLKVEDPRASKHPSGEPPRKHFDCGSWFLRSCPLQCSPFEPAAPLETWSTSGQMGGHCPKVEPFHFQQQSGIFSQPILKQHLELHLRRSPILANGVDLQVEALSSFL